MNYSQLEYYVSQPRINRFLRACGNSKSKAQKLYKINLRVSQAFYPLLNLFEIFLRNTIHGHVATHFNDMDWIITQKNGFMNADLLAQSNYFLKASVIKAENNIRKFGGTVTSGKIVAEQTLGFWTSFFDGHHYGLLSGIPIGAFPFKPRTINRSVISTKLKRIREFRNRIYHNEPICFKGSIIDFSTATNIMNDVHDIIQWINPVLLDYTEYFNNINRKIAMAANL